MARHSVAKRSHPTSEVRGRSREYQTATARNGREELPHTPKPEARGGGQEEQPTPKARGGDERSYPEPWLRWPRRA